MHFANIRALDESNGAQYACIVQNEVMRRFQDGSYAMIRPAGSKYIIQEYKQFISKIHIKTEISPLAVAAGPNIAN